MKVPYTKMNGCKNDYIYVDLRPDSMKPFRGQNWPEWSRILSPRNGGIGSDGLILIGPAAAEDKDAVAAMRIFNADGSEAEMCGNGIRCVAKILYETIGPKPSYKIRTLAGLRECFVTEATDPKRFQVRVNMGRPSFLPAKIPVLFDDVMVMDEEFEVAGENFKVSCVSMGNPHCVVEVPNLEAFDVAKYGPLIEKHEVFPQGVNVEFIQIKGTEVFQRTWERGSAETLACGTGACAVGVIQIMKTKLRSPVKVRLRGGDLQIEWDGLREVWMTGEAVTESVGEIDVQKLGLAS